MTEVSVETCFLNLKVLSFSLNLSGILFKARFGLPIISAIFMHTLLEKEAFS